MAVLRGVFIFVALLLVTSAVRAQPRGGTEPAQTAETGSALPSAASAAPATAEAPDAGGAKPPAVATSASPETAPSPTVTTSASAAESAPAPLAPLAPVASAAAPIPPVAASVSAAPSASSSAVKSAGIVKVHEREVFTIRVPRGGLSPQDRARAAAQALTNALEDAGGGEAEVRVEEQEQLAVVFIGKTPIVTLGPEDAAAEGDLTLHVHAASVANRVQETIRSEKKRSAIATTVFSFSLLVFSGLLAFLLLRRVGEMLERIRVWVEGHSEGVPALRLGQIEVVSSAAVGGGLGITIRVGHRLVQAAIVYGWVLIALSLFESTRGYSERLTGFVLRPLSALMGRIGSALPVLVVTFIAVGAVIVLVRFVGLFFGSVARGETKLGWMPQDLAGPTSVLVRAGIAVVSLVVASPLITGSDEGALSRAGVAALVAVGLACTPLLACAAVGIPVVFGRRLRTGEHAEIGGRAGRIRGVTLLEVRLEDPFGCEVRVPHILGLWHVTRIFGRVPLMAIEVVVDPLASQRTVCEVLMAAARSVSLRAKVELVSLDAEGARYRITCADELGKNLAAAVGDALKAESIALGRRGSTP